MSRQLARRDTPKLVWSPALGVIVCRLGSIAARLLMLLQVLFLCGVFLFEVLCLLGVTLLELLPAGIVGILSCQAIVLL